MKFFVKISGDLASTTRAEQSYLIFLKDRTNFDGLFGKRPNNIIVGAVRLMIASIRLMGAIEIYALNN